MDAQPKQRLENFEPVSSDKITQPLLTNPPSPILQQQQQQKTNTVLSPEGGCPGQETSVCFAGMVEMAAGSWWGWI